jgi:hypothetical protein
MLCMVLMAIDARTSRTTQAENPRMRPATPWLEVMALMVAVR